VKIGIRRGDVVVVNLDPTKGSEQKGTRPCIVVQNDIGNQKSPTTIVVPLTDAKHKPHPGPFQAFISKETSNIKKDSIAQCEQIRVTSQERILENWGSLPSDVMDAVDTAIRISLDL